MIETEFVDCECTHEAHTLRFQLECEDDGSTILFTSVFLNQYRGFFRRLWVAIKYLLRYECKDGHWDCTLIKGKDCGRLISLFHKHQVSEYKRRVSKVDQNG